jgi:cell division septal protein FtsQ
MAKSKKSGPAAASLWLLVFLPVLALALAGVALYHGVRYYVTTSDYFKIKSLRAQGVADSRYIDSLRREVVGANIFSLDVERQAAQIQGRYPTLRDIRVTRILPSELLIEARERVPVAVLHREADYLMDAEGVVVGIRGPQDPAELPVIAGLENRLMRFKVGVAYRTPGLDRALSLAELLRERAGRLSVSAGLMKEVSVRVTKIDASDPANLSFYLNEGVQVRIGDKDFARRLALLPSILRSTDADGFAQLRYIDLRSKEPVIATKSSKPKA